MPNAAYWITGLNLVQNNLNYKLAQNRKFLAFPVGSDSKFIPPSKVSHASVRLIRGVINTSTPSNFTFDQGNFIVLIVNGLLVNTTIGLNSFSFFAS